jgi:cytochrome c553
VAAGIGLPTGATRADDFFEKRIRPLLVERCFECHAGDSAEGGLRLDSRRGVAAGGASGPVVDPADPNSSLLLRLVRHEVDDRAMPQGGERLPEAAIADLARWVAQGLPGLPAEPPSPTAAANESWAARLAARRGHWAWQPVRAVRPPDVDHVSWGRTAIDRFLLVAMREAGLEPAPPAEPVTLIRRLTLALTGLPPTIDEVDAFLADRSADRVERLVARLLASPRFGEHWAGHWLDLVRFGETGGYVRDYPIPEAWRYRDYCIRAFNADVPYDRFVAEHVAGDLLPPRHNAVLNINESVLGTGHLRLMEISSTATDVALEEAQMVESQIDTLGKAFQGLTIACARCHDHKFDAISQRDYYALFGTLASARQTQVVIDDESVRQSGVTPLADLKSRVVAALAGVWREDLAAVGAGLVAKSVGKPVSADSGVAGTLSSSMEKPLAEAAKAVDHPLHAVAAAWQAGRAGQDPAAAFVKAADAVRRLAAERSRANDSSFRVAADFTASPGSWHARGVLPDTLHRAASDVAIAPAGDEIVARVIGPGFATDRLSRKHGGSVRSEDFPLDARFVSLRVAGGDAAQIRLIQHNFQQMENVAHGAKVRHVDSRLPTWVTLPVGHQPSWQGGRSYLELVTKDDVAHFRRSDAGDGPFRRTVADRTGRSWFAVERVVWHDGPEPPADELEASLLVVHAAGTPADGDNVAGGFVAAGSAAVEAFAQGTATTAEARLLNALLTGGLLRNRLEAVDESTRLLVHRFRQIEEQIPRFRRAPAMTAQGPGFDAAIQKRGQPPSPANSCPGGISRCSPPRSPRENRRFSCLEKVPEEFFQGEGASTRGSRSPGRSRHPPIRSRPA